LIKLFSKELTSKMKKLNDEILPSSRSVSSTSVSSSSVTLSKIKAEIDSDDDSFRKIDPNIRKTNSDNLVSTIPIKSQKKTIISTIEDVASSAVGTARRILKLPKTLRKGGLKYHTKLRAHLRKTHKITKHPKYINNNVTKCRR
jgi:hypothetical protein